MNSMRPPQSIKTSPQAQDYSPLPVTPMSARLSALLGVLSLLTTALALWLSTSWFPDDVWPSTPSLFDLLRFASFWLFWLGIPFCSIMSGLHARKRATAQEGLQFISSGLICSYLSILILGNILVIGLCPALLALPR